VSGRPSPELRVLDALDELRNAFAAVFAELPEPPEPTGLLTLNEAARRVGIRRSTATGSADSGRLRTVGTAYSCRVPAAELERLAAKQEEHR
jgi:hypothetical protein